ncbi:hypothetical protein GBAR_LOCUS14321, partial [Geodia barretti]
MATSAILLHQSLSRPNFTIISPLNEGVNDLAFF